MSWNNFCSCSRTIGYKNRADADACRSNCCIRGFASARRNVGKDRPHPERSGRDNAGVFSCSWLTPVTLNKAPRGVLTWINAPIAILLLGLSLREGAVVLQLRPPEVWWPSFFTHTTSQALRIQRATVKLSLALPDILRHYWITSLDYRSGYDPVFTNHVLV